MQSKVIMEKTRQAQRPEEPIQDHTICGLRFTDNELLLTLGYNFNRRELRMPLSRFPALEKATVGERQRFTMHREHTVIYWYGLKEKLVAKDVESGASTQRRPEGASEYDFIYKSDAAKPLAGLTRVNGDG